MLAGNEYVCIARSDARDQFKHRLHDLRLGNKCRAALRLQQTILGFKVLCPLQRVAELDLSAENTHQPLVFPWLLYEIASPAAHGFNRDVDASPGGHDNHGQSAVKCLD